MRRELRRVQRRLAFPFAFFLTTLAMTWTASLAQQLEPAEDSRVNIDFEERLQFYLDQQSKDFLVETAAKETLLLQMIQNIAAEIKARGATAILRDEPGFEPLYNDLEGLITQYSEEISRVKQLLSDIIELKELMEKEQRYGMADAFRSLKDSLAALIEDRTLFKKLPATTSHISNLMKEYNLELEYFENLYKKAQQFEKEANRAEDAALLQKIAEAKKKISSYLASDQQAQGDTLVNALAGNYFEEVKSVISLLQELEALERQAVPSRPGVVADVEKLRRDVLSKLDVRLLKLLGYDKYVNLKGPTVSQLFREWRKARLAAYEAKFSEYLVIKTSLLANGNARQRARMLERDVTDALLNYAEKNYLLAELQLTEILGQYQDYFTRFDAVHFYRAEARYARLLYEKAWEDYSILHKEYPNSEFEQDVLLRLLTIAQTLNWREEFYRLYEDFQTAADSLQPKIRNRIYYLAGYYLLQLQDIKGAEQALSQIEKGSKYYYPGLYLSGLSMARRGAYTGAVSVFSILAESDNLPWTDPNLAMIRNNAILKLGYIHYERGEYAKAIEYFNRVSKGIDGRDRVLIGMAWSKMKNGDYENAIGDINELIKLYLSSNYTYEALVLAAHCKRLLNQPDEALRDLRYVATARGVLDLANDYYTEREKFLHQLDELERMEKEVLEIRDRQLFDVIAQIRRKFHVQLLNLGRESGMANNLLSEFQAEQQAIYRQIQELDAIINDAMHSGMDSVLKDALRRRKRLMKALLAYKPNESFDRMNYFIRYPLATRESSTNYRIKIIKQVMREMEYEKQRIENDLQETRKLLATRQDPSLQIDLTALQQDLEALTNKLDRFQTWLSTYDVEDLQTDFDHWADFSGFGMSDITVQELQRRENQISEFSKNLASIDALMRIRRQELEERLGRFDSEIDAIREELEEEQLKLKKLEHERLFEDYYFDTSTSEWLPNKGGKPRTIDAP